MKNRRFRIRPVGHSSWVVEVKKWYGWATYIYDYESRGRYRKTFVTKHEAYDALVEDLKYDYQTECHQSQPPLHYSEIGLMAITHIRDNPF